MGISAHHYHIDATTIVGGFIGLPTGPVSDTWIADAGYLVALEAKGLTNGGVSIELTSVNDPATTRPTRWIAPTEAEGER